MFSLHRTCVILATFAFIGAASGCGQAGPLFMPGEPPPAKSQSGAYDAQSDEISIQPNRP